MLINFKFCPFPLPRSRQLAAASATMWPHVATLLLLLIGAAAEEATVHVLADVKSASALMMQHEKVVLMLHVGGCPRADEFTPNLQTIAERVPNVAIGRVDVDQVANLNAQMADKAQLGMPQLKAYFRNAPPARRVLVYRGQATLDAVLAWVQAIGEWDGSATLPEGWEVGTKKDFAKDFQGDAAKPAKPKGPRAKRKPSAKEPKDEV